MQMVKRAALVVMSGLLIGMSASAWATMPGGNTAEPNHGEMIADANSPLFATEISLEPSVALQAARQGHSNCRASHIYGTDVVGEKNACIMGGYTVPGSYGVGAVGGMAAAAR
jgi:hypothetical protein